MARAGLLWLLGVPIPILLLMWVTGLAALEAHAPGIMQTIWQVLATGMGVVMITTTIAVIIGLCVLLWWTHRID